MLTSEDLRQLLVYDPATGDFTWLPRLGNERGTKIFNSRFAGKIAGRKKLTVYKEIAIDSKLYYSHRLAWLYMTGAWPSIQIDHINGNKTDNRFANLRPADESQNLCNVGVRSNNKLGIKGVSWSKANKGYCAFIAINRKQNYLGTFDTPELAHAAYCEAAERLHGEFSKVA